MRQFIPALFLVLFSFSANTVPAQCLDYDSVLPVIGEVDCPNPLIATDVWQSFSFAIEAVGPTSRRLVVYSINDPELPEQVATMDLPFQASMVERIGINNAAF